MNKIVINMKSGHVYELPTEQSYDFFEESVKKRDDIIFSGITFGNKTTLFIKGPEIESFSYEESESQ